VYASVNKTVGCLGAALGALSDNEVHEAIDWVGKRNLGETAELDTLAFGEGTPYSSVQQAQLNDLDAKGYVFLIKRKVPGSYFNASWTCSDGDYDTLEATRTMDKAQRLAEAALERALSQPIYVEPGTGFITSGVIASLKAAINQPLRQMEGAGNVSGYSAEIQPDQDVASTRRVTISINAVGVQKARDFDINLGYAPKLA
jgi:hypothetical protein